VHLDHDAVYEMLNDPDGMVGHMQLELSEQAADVARGAVHVRPGTPRSRAGRNSTARPPGFTKADIRVHMDIGEWGLYGGVNAAADPTVYLEDPARQMYRPYPFLTTGLDSLELDEGGD
jgi:hypothetical protein